MSAIDIQAVGSDAAAAILKTLAGAGKDIGSYAGAEAKKLATSAAEIAQLRLAGTIDDEEAKLQLDIQKNASLAVLEAIEGISIIAAEQAINAALNVVAKAVKSATGLAFLT